MSAEAVMNSDASDIVREGWDLLVEKLGLQKATQFVVLLERGKGDSVKEINDFWGKSSIDEIHSRVVAWKNAAEPSA
jgi:hypothetical protein